MTALAVPPLTSRPYTNPATAAMFADAIGHAVRPFEKEHLAVIFEEEDTRLDAARAARWFHQGGYRLVRLDAEEDQAFFWLSAPARQQKGVEVCCGRDIPMAPWLADKITRLLTAVAREGYLPILPATCIALNPVLSRLEGAGFSFAGIATFEEIRRQASRLNRIFPVLVAVKDEKARDALLRRLAPVAIVLPAAPEPDFSSRFIHHVLGHKDGRAALTLFSPRKKGEMVDFYSGLVAFYQDFFEPGLVEAELKSCLARTEIGVLRRLRDNVRDNVKGGEDEETEMEIAARRQPEWEIERKRLYA